MRASTSASQACGSMSFILAVTIRLYMAAARWPPRSEPAKSHDFLPRAMPRSPRSAALFDKQTRPSSSQACEGWPALQHIVHGLGNVAAARELGPLRAHPGFELSNERRGELLSNGLALLRRPPIVARGSLEARERGLRPAPSRGDLTPLTGCECSAVAAAVAGVGFSAETRRGRASLRTAVWCQNPTFSTRLNVTIRRGLTPSINCILGGAFVKRVCK